jgi:hypothetical protein
MLLLKVVDVLSSPCVLEVLEQSTKHLTKQLTEVFAKRFIEWLWQCIFAASMLNHIHHLSHTVKLLLHK